MSPESPIIDTEFVLGQTEFGEYAPTPETRAETFDALYEDEGAEARSLDPITADLLDYKGGTPEQWTLEQTGDGYTFDGEQVRDNKTGEAWQGFTLETIEQLRTSEFVRLPDYEEAGKFTVTYLIKGHDNSIRYEMRTTELREPEDTETDRTFETFDLTRYLHAPEQALLEVPTANAEHVEAMSAALAAGIETPMTTNEIPDVFEVTSDYLEARTNAKDHPLTNALDQEHSNILSELLMERLPAYDVEEQTVVALKAPEITPRSVVETIVEQQTQTIAQAAPEHARFAPLVAPRAETTERFPEGAIVQISKPREVITPRIEHAPLIVEASRDQIDTRGQRVIERNDVRTLETSKAANAETQAQPEQKMASTKEAFRIRRGREMRFDQYRAPVSHHGTEETMVATPRSVAESAVIKMLERFAPAHEMGRRAESIEQIRENPIAALEATPTIVGLNNVEQSSQQAETRADEVVLNNVVSFEAARNERLARTETHEIIAADGLPRTSGVEITSVSSTESFTPTPSRRPPMADIANDNQGGIAAKRGPITMRRAA